jgi:hypothetical protein
MATETPAIGYVAWHSIHRHARRRRHVGPAQLHFQYGAAEPAQSCLCQPLKLVRRPSRAVRSSAALAPPRQGRRQSICGEDIQAI